MKRRKASLDDGSLELLLDTICNTFGGIIFLALLMALLVNVPAVGSDGPSDRRSPPRDPAADARRLAELELRRVELLAESRRLRAAELARIEAVGVLSEPGLREAVDRLKAIEAELSASLAVKDQVLEALARLAGESLEVGAKVAEVEEETVAARERRDQLAKRAEDLARDVLAAAHSRTRTATAPKLARGVSLEPLFFDIQNGRLYGPVVHRGPNGVPILNRVDFNFPEENGATYIEPRRDAGVAIDPDGGNLRALSRKLSFVDRNAHYVDLHVWEDSFEHYDSVSRSIEEVGALRSVTLWKTGTRLGFGASDRRSFIEQ